MAKINVRSPYYVYLNESNLERAALSLWIYTGTQGARPTTPTYNLNANAVNFTVNFEIAELVKDYMDYNADDYETEIVWVDYRIAKTVGGIGYIMPIVENKAFYGYGYFQEGINPQNDSGLLQSNLTVVKLDDAPVVLPIDTSKVTSVDYYSENQEIYKQTFAPTTTSSTQIQYVSNTVNGADEFRDRVYLDNGTFEGNICLDAFLDSNTTFPVDTIYINSDDGVDLIKVENITECKYEPYKLSFINKFGALQNLWFFKRSNKQLSTKAEDFKRNTLVANSYDVDKHQQKNLYKMGNEKMDLNTGFYPEEYNEVFKQMQLSEDCWIEIDNLVLPVNVSDSSFSYKTSLNDKLINYSIKIDFAFDTINNIR
jgi:hypothetical protein